MIRRQCLALILALVLIPSGLGSADLPRLSDAELLEAVDAATLLGQIASGVYRWRS